IVGLRPTFDAKLRGLGSIERQRARRLMFSSDLQGPLDATFVPAEGDAPGPDSVSSFETWGDLESDTTQASSSLASPRSAATALTAGSADRTARIDDGATPAIPRAVALSSTTPAPADSTPVEIAAFPNRPPDALARSRPAGPGS